MYLYIGIILLLDAALWLWRRLFGKTEVVDVDALYAQFHEHDDDGHAHH